MGAERRKPILQGGKIRKVRGKADTGAVLAAVLLLEHEEVELVAEPFFTTIGSDKRSE